VKLLVADDNRDNIDLVLDILSMTGHDILTAFDGTTALDLAHSTLPDLILLDVNMPGLSGFEVCERLKGDERTKRIPVIMLTALTDVDSRVKGLAVGADDYLTKPFSPRELLARVDRSLKAKVASDDLMGQKERVRLTFERYVASSIVEELLKNPDQVKLGGRLQEVTVLFADLEGFTGLSERTDPQELLRVLNAYHALMVKIITRYEGTLDKFVGDGVMALYNTPVEQPDHIARAVKTALHIQDELYWFHEKLEPQYRLSINFGINTGMAVVGNVGTDKLMNFTAVGDAVNVASRLQDMATRGQVLVSKPVYDAVEAFVLGRARGIVKVKGRVEGVDVFQVSNSPIED
jgi:class 3 adenylate cyclase